MVNWSGSFLQLPLQMCSCRLFPRRVDESGGLHPGFQKCSPYWVVSETCVTFKKVCSPLTAKAGTSQRDWADASSAVQRRQRDNVATSCPGVRCLFTNFPQRESGWRNKTSDLFFSFFSSALALLVGEVVFGFKRAAFEDLRGSCPNKLNVLKLKANVEKVNIYFDCLSNRDLQF